MSREHTRLRRRFGFDEWTAGRVDGRKLFAWGFVPEFAQLNAWAAERSRRIQGPDGRWLTRSLWRPERGAGDRRLHVDLVECESDGAAHRLLLDLLGSFESPLIARLEEGEVGDVAFGGGGSRSPTTIAFARANLVLLVRDSGRPSGRVADACHGMDTALTGGAGADWAGDAAPLEAVVERDSLRVVPAEPVALEVPVVDVRRPERWCAFFTRTGDVTLEGGRPVYVPPPAGPDSLEIVTIEPVVGAERRALDIQVEPPS